MEARELVGNIGRGVGRRREMGTWWKKGKRAGVEDEGRGVWGKEREKWRDWEWEVGKEKNV